MMNAIRRIKQFAGKKSRQSLSRLFERDGSSAYCIAAVKFIADGWANHKYCQLLSLRIFLSAAVVLRPSKRQRLALC